MVITAMIDGSPLLDNYTVVYNVGQLTVQHVAILPDPLVPGQVVLFVGGSANDDKIQIKAKGNQIEIRIDSGKVKRVELVSGSFSRLVVYGAEGNDQIQVHDNVTIPAWLFGGDGHDHLRAGGGPSLLMGGSGNDKLRSGRGRGVLIGGFGADHLLGGKADDILIGAATDYDANDAALAAIMDEWNSAGSYTDRVKRLSGAKPGGKNGMRYLNAKTVQDDGQRDRLIGGAGLEWYFANLDESKNSDRISGLKKDEIRTTIR